MANYTIQNLKDDLTGIMHGTTLNKVTNLNALFRRAARNFLTRVDPPETMRKQQVTVYNSITTYSPPSDLKGTKILDIRPQVNRNRSDNFDQRNVEAFDLRKTNNTFALEWDSTTKRLRLSKSVSPSGVTLHQMNSVTANGTWSGGGDASATPTADTLNKVSGSASLNFDLSGAGTTGYIENSTMTDVDLSDEEDVGSMFVWVYLPDASAITNVILFWGSSSTAYWSVTSTSPHDASSFKDGWNLVAFDWNGATETGSPDSSAVDYVRVTITYDGTADTDFRVDKIFCERGVIFEVIYYSEFLFRSSTGTWKETADANEDIVNLDVDGYNLFVNECALCAAQQTTGEDSVADREWFTAELFGDAVKSGLYELYQRDHPSQAIKQKRYYYR